MPHAFEAALDAAGRETPADPPAAPHVRIVPDLPAATAGHHQLWEAAAAWTPEADPPPPPPPPPPAPTRLSAAPEAVAAELNLNALASLADVAQARRRFMWANHPDRRPDLDRDLANRRVAVANMLLDRVQWWLLRGRGR